MHEFHGISCPHSLVWQEIIFSKTSKNFAKWDTRLHWKTIWEYLWSSSGFVVAIATFFKSSENAEDVGSN